MDKEKEIEDRHEIASIINHCMEDGYFNASQLARRITQAGYGNIKEAVREFAEKLKERIHGYEEISNDTDNCLCEDIDELVKEF